MINDFKKETEELLKYVCDNYDHVKDIAHSDVYKSRNLAASAGLELTPDEVRDCLLVLRWALKVVEC